MTTLEKKNKLQNNESNERTAQQSATTNIKQFEHYNYDGGDRGEWSVRNAAESQCAFLVFNL